MARSGNSIGADRQTRARAVTIILAAGCAAVPFVASPAAQASERPQYRLLRHEEDWSALCDPSRRQDLVDHLKCIPLPDSRGGYLTFGGELRQRYEFTRNPGFDPREQDRWGAWQQRFVGHADLHLGPHLRLFGQVLSGQERGFADPASSFDVNRLDVQQAFVELRAPLKAGEWRVRLGRQELRYGSARLIDVREGPNVRRKFDGAVASLAIDRWRVDLIAVSPARLRIAAFDDDTDTRAGLWGAYATGTAPDWLPFGSNIDLYALSFRNQRARFDRVSGDEQRHSLGVRLFGARGGVDWNWEAIAQTGNLSTQRVTAWSVQTDTGYTFRATPWEPRIGFGLNAASGDRNPRDAKLETFNSLFMRANFFSELALLGTRNFWNIAPTLTLRPHRDVTIEARASIMWRMSVQDGLYRPSGALFRSGAGSRERFVGTELSIANTWRVNERLRLSANFGRFWPGPFIRATGPARPIDQIELTAQYRF